MKVSKMALQANRLLYLAHLGRLHAITMLIAPGKGF